MTYLPWLFLAGAGIIEVGWALSLKLTDGYRNVGFLCLNVGLGLMGSFCLAQAMRVIPVSTAYPIWKGAAIIGIVVCEIHFDKQPFTASKLFFLSLIIIGIIGLRGPALGVK